MILDINMKVKVHSSNGDTDYFETVAGVLQGVTLDAYLFIICLDYAIRISIDKIKHNGFKLKKKKKTDDTPHKQLRTWSTPMT